jgi:plastocyanin
MMCRAAVFMVAVSSWLIAPDAFSQPLSPEMVVVHLSNFAINPDKILLHSGRLTLLHIVNDSSGGHNLAAPELFAASTFPGGAPPVDGKVEVGSKQSKDVVFIPGVPGNYKAECTHFLHSLFGMTGSIVVERPAH